MKTILKTIGAGLALAMVSIAPASAGVFSQNFGPATSFQSGFDFNFALALPTNIGSDATLTILLEGDFNSNNENARISLAGLSLGRVLDGNTGNDRFNFANNDRSIRNPGVATITLAEMQQLFQGGSTLSLVINTSNRVRPSRVRGTISYNTVPEPAVLGLMGLGLFGIGAAAARRRRTK